MILGASPDTMSRTVIVVPCFNEAQRLPVQAFVDATARERELRFLFVDDGSTDATREVLAGLEGSDPERFTVIAESHNRGKAEAVRTGMRAAFATDPAFAGYWDADLSTPLTELPLFWDALARHPDCQIAMGARVALLGRRIERRALRHYAGRVFATVASTVLGLPVYDTQCGAKVFRVNAETRALFAEPFCVGWSFDVELIARLLAARRARGSPDLDGYIRELPLREWKHVPGSRVGPLDFAVAMLELARIRQRYFRA